MKYVQLTISFLLVIFKIGFDLEVQANHNEILPLNSFLESWERQHIQNLKDAQLHLREPTESYEQEKAEFDTIKRRRHHKKNKVVSINKNRRAKANILPHYRKEKKRKNKKRKVKSDRRFVKTILKDVNRDSKMSDSKENDINRKPVDIIVHIKMKD